MCRLRKTCPNTSQTPTSQAAAPGRAAGRWPIRSLTSQTLRECSGVQPAWASGTEKMKSPSWFSLSSRRSRHTFLGGGGGVRKTVKRGAPMGAGAGPHAVGHPPPARASWRLKPRPALSMRVLGSCRWEALTSSGISWEPVSDAGSPPCPPDSGGGSAMAHLGDSMRVCHRLTDTHTRARACTY